MNTPVCHREEEVVKAVISGQIDSSISEHLNTCDSCRAVADLTGLFQGVKADDTESEVDMRAADLVWIEAAYALHKRQKRHRKLGLTIGAISGILMTGLTGLIISPQDVSVSLEQIGSVSCLSLSFLAPLMLIVLALSLVVFAERANGTLSRY